MAARCTYEYTFLYRLLREDEFPVEYGLYPENPNALVSVHDHVVKGSFIASCFISTSASLEALIYFARRSDIQPARIAAINLEELEESEEVDFYDLTDPNVRNLYLYSRRAKRRADKIEEVLVTGRIPSYCVYYVADIECQFEFLYRLLRKTENVYEDGIEAKDKEAGVSVRKFVLDGHSLASQFISTCASFKAVKKFSQNACIRLKQVAKINVRRLMESACVGFIDLTVRKNRELYLENDDSEDDAWIRARHFREVLIIGDIPADCVDDVIVL